MLKLLGGGKNNIKQTLHSGIFLILSRSITLRFQVPIYIKRFFLKNTPDTQGKMHGPVSSIGYQGSTVRTKVLAGPCILPWVSGVFFKKSQTLNRPLQEYIMIQCGREFSGQISDMITLKSDMVELMNEKTSL